MWRLRDSTCYLNDICLLKYMYLYFIAEENDLVVKQLFYITSLCNIFVYSIEESNAIWENLCYYFGMQIEK